jgi:hypothetical protein
MQNLRTQTTILITLDEAEFKSKVWEPKRLFWKFKDEIRLGQQLRDQNDYSAKVECNFASMTIPPR